MADQADRIIITKALSDIEVKLKELQILYEKYFSQAEKREPIKEREELAKRLRQFLNRKIIQTDVRYRYQNLASRFHSYTRHWDRIVRKIEEGKYFRSRLDNHPEPDGRRLSSLSKDDSQVDSLYDEFLRVRKSCNLEGNAPDRAQIAAFLAQQKEKIAQKVGSSNIDLSVQVVAEGGKPKIKVKVKKVSDS